MTSTYMGFDVGQMIHCLGSNTVLLTIRHESGQWYVFADGVEHQSQSMMMALGKAFDPYREKEIERKETLGKAFAELQSRSCDNE